MVTLLVFLLLFLFPRDATQFFNTLVFKYAYVSLSNKNLYCSITYYADSKILRNTMFGVIRKLTRFSYFLPYKNRETSQLHRYFPCTVTSYLSFPFLLPFFLFFLPTMDSLCLFDPHRNARNSSTSVRFRDVIYGYSRSIFKKKLVPFRC